MTTDLLADPLPAATASMDVVASEFFTRCETIAIRLGWEPERQTDPHDPEHFRLNIHRPSGEATLWLVARGQTLELEVERQSGWGCRDYAAALGAGYGALFRRYTEAYGIRPRLTVGRCAPEWDRAPWTRDRLSEVRFALHEAVTTLAVEPGNVPARLRAAMPSLMDLDLEQFPPPLRHVWARIRKQVTSRQPTNPRFGTLDATLVRMRSSTGAKIAEEIVAIARAVDELSGVPWDLRL
jgi:hypothetical protein